MAVSSLAQKMLKSSKLKGSGLLSKTSEVPKTFYDTGIYALNLAFTASLFDGPSDGLTCLAGKSKSFKTLFGLISAKAYMDKEPDAYMIFYDSEGGAAKEYFQSVGIDIERVIHIPIMNIEELKFDLVGKLEMIKAEYEASGVYPKFMIFVDSVGNLASLKEVKDAKDEKSVADMTRAKELKGMFRICTPYLTMYNLHMCAIMHTYDEIGGRGAPKQIMSGGTGPMYSANQVFIIGKRQIKKQGEDLQGWSFVINVEKSRSVKEKAQIPVDVRYEGGIDKFSGLLDIAQVTGDVTKPKVGWYTRPGVEGDKNWREKETSTEEFWKPLLDDKEFQQKVKEIYSLSSKSLFSERLSSMIQEDEEGDLEFDPETGEILE